MRNRLSIFAVLVVVMLFAGVRAQAVGASYTLTCEMTMQGRMSLILTSFSTGVSGGGTVQTGGKHGPYLLAAHFAPSQVYQMLSASVDRNEVISHCELVEESPSMNGQPALELTWTFKNGVVTSVSAVGADDVTPMGTPRVPEGAMSAAFSFQEVNFTSKAIPMVTGIVRR